MADPTVVTLTKNTWVKVASSVTAATIDIRLYEGQPIYQTYRMAGNAAPTDLSDATICESAQLVVSTSAAIDVYLYAFDQASSARVSI